MQRLKYVVICIALPLFWGLIAFYITLPFIMYVFKNWGAP